MPLYKFFEILKINKQRLEVNWRYKKQLNI